MRSCERKRRGTRESSCEVEDSVLGYEHRYHGCLLYVDFLSSLIVSLRLCVFTLHVIRCK